MNVQLRSRNGHVSERQRKYIEEKLARLTRYLDHITTITVEIAHEQTRAAGEVYRTQATLVADHGTILRAEEREGDLLAAVDQLYDTLQRQIERYKDKHWRRGRLRRQGGEIVAATAEPAVEEEESAPSVVRTKRVPLKPMYSDEAIEQMELLGHTFFVYRDADTSSIQVVYRRRDGNYGILLPEDAG